MSGSNNSETWCTIESDPGVLTELLESVGCTGIQLTELYSLDEDAWQSLDRVYGLIFLFQWQGATQQAHAQNRPPLEECPENLFFAHQVTTNACATQALLSVVLNVQEELEEDSASSSSFTLGPVLTEFKAFTQSFPPQLKGTALSSSEPLRKAHNAFAPADAFLLDATPRAARGSDKGEAFHFVSYIPFYQKAAYGDHTTTLCTVYELDGLQSGPIEMGTVPEEESSPQAWLRVAIPAIQERIQAWTTAAASGTNTSDIKFNLMAVIPDPRIQLTKEMAACQEQLQLLQQQQQQPESSSDDTAESVALYTEKLEALAAQLAAEQGQREQWRWENQRRRHNFVPAVVRMLQELARLQLLPNLLTQAQQRQAEKRRQQQQSSK